MGTQSESMLRRAAIGLVAAGVLVTATVVITYRADRQVEATSYWVSHTNEVLAKLASLLESVREAESNVRAFVITGHEDYLRDYDENKREIPALLEEVRHLTADNPTQQARLERAQLNIQKRLSHSDEVVRLRRTSGTESASALVIEGAGKDAMTEVDTAITAMESEESQLLSVREAELSVTSRRTRLTFLSVVGADILLLLLVYWTLQHYAAERRRHLITMEEQNRALQMRTVEAERASAMKSKFLANMSHELRTPLNSILGFSELLQDQTVGTLNEKQRRWIVNVRTAGKHLLQLINDILDLSKIEAGQLQIAPERFVVSAAIPEVLTIIRPLAMSKQITIEQQIAPDVLVLADRVRLKQILYNLLSNAVKFSPEKTTISLVVVIDGEFCRISIRDRGVGIPNDKLDYVFEEFSQLDPTSSAGVVQGTGLGLAITRRLVEKQGGSISVTSEVGQGTEFVFTVPLAQDPVEERIPRTTRSFGSRERPLVLAIDDESTALELLTEHLRSAGYDVEVAMTMQQGLALARDLLPDVITLDILMPSGSGWAVLAQLKTDQKTAHIPVVVVSILDRQDVGFALGANDYLVKPIQKGALLGMVDRLIGGKGQKQKVLIVDDNLNDLNVITEIAASAGYETETAMTGSDGLAKVGAMAPALVLLDLVLPDIDGLEVLQRIRSRPDLADLPVVIVTAKEVTREEMQVIEKSATAHVRKIEKWKVDLLARMESALKSTNS